MPSFDNVPAQLMSVKEAAKLLNLSETTVWKYALAGVFELRQARLPGGKTGGARRVTRSSVEAWINGYDGHTQPAPAPLAVNNNRRNQQ